MGVVSYLQDRLSNLVSALGTARDKAASSSYSLTRRDPLDYEAAYRMSWLAGKLVDIPAEDSCSKWRNWQADEAQITAIEAEEKRLGLQDATLRARTLARLYGGAAIYIGTRDRDTREPLRPEAVPRGGIAYLTVIPSTKLKAGELQSDPVAPGYGLPAFYTISGPGGTADIHPSRLVRFVGRALPDPEYSAATGYEYGWGDSVLMRAYTTCLDADATVANIASLIFEAKVDVFRIPGFMEQMGDDKFRQTLLQRFTLAATAKGVNGALLLDKEEEYLQKQMSFANLPEVIDRFLQLVCGAADVPATRLLGQSPGGLNSTGESDLRNYYDRITSEQSLLMSPALYLLDEGLIRSALGSRPPEVHYLWAPLWRPTAKEAASIGETAAKTVKTLKETALFPNDALASAAVNMLTEHGVMPGLDAAIAESAEAAGERDEIGEPGGGEPGEPGEEEPARED